MRELELKNKLGIFLIGSQFAILGLLIILQVLGGFRYEETTTAIALIMPMLAVYGTAVIRYFIENQQYSRRQGPKQSPYFVFLSFSIPGLFVAAIVIVILLRSYNSLTFEQFKTYLGILEVAFAVYVGMFIKSLYGESL